MTSGSPTKLTLRARLRLGTQIRQRHLKEFLSFDFPVFQVPVAVAGLLVTLCLLALGKRARAFAGLMALHRANWSGLANSVAETLVRQELHAGRSSVDPPNVFRQHVRDLQPTPGTERFFEKPTSLLRTRILVLKSPRPSEKGILVIDYSFVFPIIAKFFDLPRIAEKYHIVTEPSWSGYCDPNVLCYGINDFPVFVQAFEPRDAQVLEKMRTNLVPVATSPNWWIDHRVMKPLNIPKDRDLVMIASWAKFKRHARFFAALAKLRQRGHTLTATLIGYPIDLTIADLANEADFYGVRDQVEFHEWLRPDEVNVQLNRARINIVWSRREGVNRAIVEGMFANVPCILRSGFNYGYQYPYVNAETGRFATEESLPDAILELLETPREYAPRDWVMAHMSCHKAIDVLAGTIRERAARDGERWTTDPVPKIGQLNTMAYWDVEDAERFEPDYRFLESTFRSRA